jgi:hypothetical protein
LDSYFRAVWRLGVLSCFCVFKREEESRDRSFARVNQRFSDAKGTIGEGQLGKRGFVRCIFGWLDVCFAYLFAAYLNAKRAGIQDSAYEEREFLLMKDYCDFNDAQSGDHDSGFELLVDNIMRNFCRFSA